MTPAKAQERANILEDLAVIILLAENVHEAEDADGIKRLRGYAEVCRTKYGLRSVGECMTEMASKAPSRRQTI